MWPVTLYSNYAGGKNEKRNRRNIYEFHTRVFALADAGAMTFVNGDDYIEHDPLVCKRCQ